jgi:hypothetical protein
MDPIAAAIADHEARLHSIEPPPDPEPEPGEDPWGLSLMPLPAGWQRKFYTNFREDGDRQIGSGIGPHLAAYFKPRRAMGDSSQRGTYNDLTTFSQTDGVADVFLHSGAANSLAHDGLGKVHHVFALVDQIDRAEVRVQWTEKCPTTEGRKQAPLFWAFGTNVNGEHDHYEHKYGAGPRSNAFSHFMGGGGQEAIKLNVVTTEPHVLSMHFKRGEHFSVYVDGQLRKKFTTKIGTNQMHAVMQIETFLKRDHIPGWCKHAEHPNGVYHGTASAGHVQFTQISVEAPA